MVSGRAHSPNQMIVVSMRANPEPDHFVTLANAERAPMNADANGPHPSPADESGLK